MTIQARKRATNKKRAASKAKAHDRKLLKQAAAEAAEGAPLDAVAAIPVVEFQSICLQLKDLTHVVVDAWACRDGFADGLETVLVKLHAARLNLESAAEVQS